MKGNKLHPISTNAAPAAIGPYSQGIVAGDLVFTSGQLPMEPSTDNLVTGDVKEKTHQIIRNIEAILKAAGTDLAHVVKTTIFLVNLENYAAVNEVYARYFGAALPARSVIQVSALPKNVDIEIEAIAILP